MQEKITKTCKMTGSLYFIYGIWAGQATSDYLLFCDNFKNLMVYLYNNARSLVFFLLKQ